MNREMAPTFTTRMAVKASGVFVWRAGALALVVALVFGLSFPSFAFATVTVDATALAQGENAVGGGSATLAESSLDMTNVTAYDFYTDQDLSVNFNGGNEIQSANVGGSAEVEMNFAGDNAVKDVGVNENADLTINANGNNEFEEVTATGDSNLTVNVTGENDFEHIGGFQNANVIVRGTDCQMDDVVNVGEGDTYTVVGTDKGDLSIDHVTVNMKGETAVVGSEEGNVRINTSKVAKDEGNDYIDVRAGGTMEVRESVIDIAGAVHSKGEMTIDHSDVKVGEGTSRYIEPSPYRVYSETDIELKGEKNGVVEEGSAGGEKVKYVDTDGTDNNNGKTVDLKANGKPAYYYCDDCSNGDCANYKLALKQALPKTDDDANPFLLLLAAAASAATAVYASRRSETAR